MNRNRLLAGLAAAALLALILSSFVYREFKRIASVSASGPMRSIVVAAEPLELGTRLDASMLRTIAWPANAPVAGMFTSIQDCVNRALITSVAENEPIMASKLASTDSGAGLPATIPPGMRGLSVAVNNVIGVAGFVTPGTKVDVLVTGAIIGANGAAGPTITRTILENVQVLAAGQKTQQDRDGKPEIELHEAHAVGVALTRGGDEGDGAGLGRHNREPHGVPGHGFAGQQVLVHGAAATSAIEAIADDEDQPAKHDHPIEGPHGRTARPKR